MKKIQQPFASTQQNWTKKTVQTPKTSEYNDVNQIKPRVFERPKSSINPNRAESPNTCYLDRRKTRDKPPVAVSKTSESLDRLAAPKNVVRNIRAATSSHRQHRLKHDHSLQAYPSATISYHPETNRNVYHSHSSGNLNGSHQGSQIRNLTTLINRMDHRMKD